ncbi:MAG: hypothetical protein HY538_02115 [Deltaproteobacteria bacterium]|nr:hypothetical protein [Deltaproteobacteria bacterium]
MKHLVLSLGLLVLTTSAFSARLSYQGVLEDGSGPVSGTTIMEFALCSTPNCSPDYGDPMWEGRYVVEVSGGIFSVELGDTSQGNQPIEASDVAVQDLYLRVIVEGEPLMTSNQYQHLVSVPYALGSQGDFIVANGNVGIGTTNPATKLEVVNATGQGEIQIKGTSASAINFVNTDASKNDWKIFTGAGVGDANSLSIWDDTSGQARLTVTSQGNVGIGTTSPANPLHVVGPAGTLPARFETAGNASRIGFFAVGAGGGNWVVGSEGGGFSITDASANKDRLVIDAQGNVGIGTTTPGYKLDVHGDGYVIGVTAPTTGLATTMAGGEILSHNGAMVFGTRDNFDIQFNAWQGVGGTEMVIQPSGNVGIGTSFPGYKLDVEGDIRTSHDIQVDNDMYVDGQMFGARLNLTGEGASSYVLGHGGGMNYGVVASTGHTFIVGGADIARISDQGVQIITGNVGIGTSPNSQYKLDVNGDIQAVNTSFSGVISQNGSGNNYFAGKVGIGNSSPQAPLHVAGNSRLDGDLLVQGEKPIKLLGFRGSKGEVWYDTKVSVLTHWCFTGGFSFAGGDINENGVSYIGRIHCKQGGFNWECGGDFASHDNNHEEVRVHVVCVKNELVDASGWLNIE